MKTKYIILSIVFSFNTIFAQEILNENSKRIFKQKELSAKKQGEITKDSWISPLIIEGDYSKSKSIGSDKKSTSKSGSINLNQDIFRSGAIYTTIKKGELEINLNTKLVGEEKQQLLSQLYSYVIDLKKIDLETKKLYYLIENKKIEIKKNESSYTNGLLDISILDESVIELSELKNQKEDLALSKINILKELKKYTKYNYIEIDLTFLTNNLTDKFIINNTPITIKKLEYKQAELDKNIITSNYFPKLSVYGSYGYENNEVLKEKDEYHNYGLKLSIPLDFNASKNTELSRLNKLIKKDELEQTSIYEKDFLEYVKTSLVLLDNKIKNLEETIIRYQSLYKSVTALYEASIKTVEDVYIMENRVASSVLDKEILLLDKKSILNKLYAKIKS